MSLINEALKKAQRSRGDGQAGETGAPFGNAGPVAKRGKARSSQTIVLIASGAIVLVVLTVVGTFWFANRPASQPERTVAKKPAEKKGAPDTPPIVVPPVNPAPPTPTTSTNPGPSAEEKSLKAGETKKGEPATAETKPGPAPVAPAPTTTPTPPAPTTTTASTPPAPVSPTANPPSATSPAGSGSAPAGSGVTTTTAAPPTATPGAPPKQDERIVAYVEGLRITAIRANDAKIIMNEKVYRVNDMVERNLGVRLVKVDPDSLTFADANGVTYVKYF